MIAAPGGDRAAAAKLAEPREGPLRPTALELAAGMPLVAGAPLDLERDACLESPLAALERTTLPALLRPPCVVTFSGGRDSSVVLAAATRMARRAGLEPPIPYTFLFPDRPEADEGAWQELVLDHLRLRERWQRDRVDDCDYVGPNAAASLRRDGVLFPPNGFLQERALDYARGGSVLTGIGGDHLFGYWSWLALAELLAGRRRPAPRDLKRLAKALLPKRVRLSPARRLARFITPPWLTAPAAREFVEAHARRLAATPIWWRNWVSFSAADPELVARRLSRDFIARHYDVRVQHPLLEAPILAALARDGGRLGLGPRTAAMRAAFGEALPDAAFGRESKADFSAAFWGPGSREFARRWDGTGVDTSLVEPEALRRDWLAPTPRYQGAMLLQAAWLAADRRP